VNLDVTGTIFMPIEVQPVLSDEVLPTRADIVIIGFSTALFLGNAGLIRFLHLRRLRLRGPSGARDEFLLAVIAQNLRKLAKLRPTNMPPSLAVT
jgi:hypothetical protein